MEYEMIACSVIFLQVFESTFFNKTVDFYCAGVPENQMEDNGHNGDGDKKGYEQADGYGHCLVVKQSSGYSPEKNQGYEYGTSSQDGR